MIFRVLCLGINLKGLSKKGKAAKRRIVKEDQKTQQSGGISDSECEEKKQKGAKKEVAGDIEKSPKKTIVATCWSRLPATTTVIKPASPSSLPSI
jgi:hypothetical protein